MLDQGLEQFRGKRILLLQGPVGPFFARLAQALRERDAAVFKINFHAGDWFFYPRHAAHYRGTMENWSQWIEEFIRREKIEVVLLYGDCRPIHCDAHRVAEKLGLEIGVFEEGYLRPNHVTLERYGVNGYSRLSRNPDDYQKVSITKVENMVVGNAYWCMIWYGFCYFMMGALGKFLFPHYRHHRSLNVLEGWPWLRSVWRKYKFQWRERQVLNRLVGQFNQRYFLASLQVFNDAQIRVHAEFDDVKHFIESTIRSFVVHAPDNTLLVFKHHPMDRGYCDYTKLIAGLAKQAGVSQRVLYIHDQHLPTLLDHARGVVVVNSTVGMSALHHHAPTKVCGNAIYDLPGLTFQESLDQFWSKAPAAKPDHDLYLRFQQYLLLHTQLNGSFYRPFKTQQAVAGLIWPSKIIGELTDVATTKDAPRAEAA